MPKESGMTGCNSVVYEKEIHNYNEMQGGHIVRFYWNLCNWNLSKHDHVEKHENEQQPWSKSHQRTRPTTEMAERSQFVHDVP